MTKDKRVHVIASQHLDVAWLWTRVSQGEDLMRQCFQRAVEMIEAWPDLPFVFSRSTPWSFYVLEQRHPKLFEKVRQYVAEGKIEVCGGEWVEPDHVMPDGEALVRQCACGQWYFLEKFGKIATVCWEPDVFAHAGTLPQIVKKAGMDGYYSHRCLPRDDQGRPLHQFVWEGTDGTRILFLAGQWVRRPDRAVVQRAAAELERTGLPATHVVIGGGSDRRITMQTDWVPLPEESNADPDLPACRWSSAEEAMRDMERHADRLPVVKGELGFQFSGTYTSNGPIKRANRRLEALLIEAEKAAAWASLDGFLYPAEQLTQAWRDLCVNQFHDICCGCCYEEANLEALELCHEVERRGKWSRDRALASLVESTKIDRIPDAEPLAVFNLLSWDRSAPVILPGPGAESTVVLTPEGQETPAQTIGEEYGPTSLLFMADKVPGIGAAVYYVKDGSKWAKPSPNPALVVRHDRLENEFLIVELEHGSGALTRLYDKRSGIEFIASGMRGNLLRFFEDATRLKAPPEHGWQPWYIGYTGQELDPTCVINAYDAETGPVRGRIRVEREIYFDLSLPPTLLKQDIILYANSPILRFETSGDWRARETTVQAEFNLSFPCATVVAEAPYGVAERAPNRDDPARKLGAEAAAADRSVEGTGLPEPDRPMQKWLDFADGEKGVAFLNNGKYGYDADTRQVRLTLLRSPYMRKELGELIGQGEFSFAYAILPHAGDWRDAALPRLGYEFNNDLIAVPAAPHDGQYGDLPCLASVSDPSSGVAHGAAHSSVLITAVKRPQEGDGIILRLFESHGRQTEAMVRLARPVQRVEECDLLERPSASPSSASARIGSPENTLSVSMKPFEIKTLRVIFA